jgi:hypothetical protein
MAERGSSSSSMMLVGCVGNSFVKKSAIYFSPVSL